MRKFIQSFVVVITVSLSSTAALAALFIYEDFDYATGQLQGNQYDPNNAAHIWQRAGVANPPSAINVVSGNLTGPEELQTSVGNSVALTGDGSSAGSTNRLWLGQANATPAPTIYYSFLLRVDALTGSSTGNIEDFLSLNNTGNASQAGNPTVRPGRVAARINANDNTKFDLGIFTNHAITTGSTSWSNNEPTLANGLTVGDTYFVVGAINFTSGTNNLAQMWINPAPSTFGSGSVPTPTRTDSTASTINTGIQSLLLRQNTSPYLTIDELRVASTWAEVTPLGGTPSRYWDIDALGETAGAGGATPSGTWDGSTTNWNSDGSGVGTKVAWSAGSGAVFSAGNDATGSYTVTISGTQSASTVTFEDGTVTLTGGQLNLTGAVHSIAANSGVTATIDSVIGGTDGLSKEGAGTLVLTASEAYSGATSINSGTLQLGNGGTTGALPAASAITVNDRLTFNRSNAVTQGVDFGGAPIAGTGGLTQSGSGTLTLNAANTFSGTTRAGLGTLLLANSLALQNSTLNLDSADNGAVSFGTLNAATLGGIAGSRDRVLENASNAAVALTIGNNNQAATYTGVLSGAGSLTKVGTGVQTLSGMNTYNGGTAINAGTLLFTKTSAMPSLSGGGDYNVDGQVDAADYVLWRKTPGSFGGDPGYGVWRSNFGASGVVTVNNGGTLAVNAGGTDEWTNSTDENTSGTIGSLIKGRGGQAGSAVNWMSGSTLAIDTSNAGGAMTYTGVIGGFRTAGGGTTNAVGFTKRGSGTLTLDANHTFTGPLTLAQSPVATDDSSTLILNGTALGAGTTMAIPTVSIGSHSTLQIAASERLPAGTLITTQTRGKLHLNEGVVQTIRSLSGTNGIIEVALGRLNIADQAGDDYTYGIASGAYIQASDGVFDPNKGTVYKSGAGTLTLMGDAGNNFAGTFFMQNGTLKLSRNQALGAIGANGRLVVTGGQLARSNASAGFTYSTTFVDLHVFRYDLGSDSPNANSQFNVDTATTLKVNNVEFNITNTESGTGRFIFLGDIRNHDPNPLAMDDDQAIRGLTKTGNGILQFNSATSYKGATTITAGTLLVDADGTIGDYNLATIAALNLQGGAVGTTASRTVPIKNPIVVDGNAGIVHISTTNNLASVLMDFDTDSITDTSGSLTISNLNTGTGNTVFQPRFTGKGYDFGLPITISASTGTVGNVKSSELQFGNLSDTQTFSGIISGGGSVRRVNAGGTTVLSGMNTYTGDTSVDAGTLTLTNPNPSNSGDVLLLTGGVLNLDFPGVGTMDTIDQLFFDGFAQAGGTTYGATGSGAANINDTFFSGDGMLFVSNSGSGSSLDGFESVPEPGAGVLMFLAACLLSVTTGRSRSRTR
jgi:autotransporter-associated beta strand protein